MRILVISAPYLVDLATGECGPFPVQSDINYHICSSLRSLGHTIIEAHFRQHEGRLTLEETAVLDDAYDCVFLDINKSPCFVEPILLNKIASLRAKAKHLFVIIPDFYLSKAKQITKLLTLYAPYADRFITFYEASQDVCHILGIAEPITRKVISVDVPTCWMEPSLRPLYDVCYIGSAKSTRTIPFASLLLAKPDLRCFLSTSARDGYSHPNILSTTTSYLDVLRTSLTCIITPVARSPSASLLSPHLKKSWVQTPSPMPGRLSEVISCGAVPILITDSDRWPHPLFESAVPKFVFRDGFFDPSSLIDGLLKLERASLIEPLKACWKTYFSPEVVLNRIMS